MFNPKRLAEKEINITIKMFRTIRRQRKRFELFVSPMVIAEINASPDWIVAETASLMNTLNVTVFPENVAAAELTLLYKDNNVLHSRHIRDLTHIAYAVVMRCDYVVSWNFKHFVNLEVIDRVKKVNDSQNYVSPFICSPYYFTGERPK
jgi:D-alanine-D-alanine ligase-like ATP-grasp enzyme